MNFNWIRALDETVSKSGTKSNVFNKQWLKKAVKSAKRRIWKDYHEL